MSTPVTIQAGTLAQPACYATDQERFEAFVAAMTAFLAGDFAAPIIQAATPDPADNDKLWIKLDGSGFSEGLFLYQDGSWQRAQPLSPPPGTIVHFYGNTDIVLTGNYTNDSAAILTLDGGDATSPYWRVCDGTNSTPDLRGLVMVGAGQGAGLTDRVFNATGGEESHVLSEAELATHSHDIIGYALGGSNVTPEIVIDDDILATQITRSTEDVGSDDPHNNMQPFRVVYPIIRTSRIR